MNMTADIVVEMIETTQTITNMIAHIVVQKSGVVKNDYNMLWDYDICAFGLSFL